MVIRRARIEDSVAIAQCLYYAMADILFAFIGKKDKESALSLLRHFAGKQNNQYSFENCWVAEEENAIVGAINVYDGARLRLLRKPVADYIHTNYHTHFNPEDETAEGEWYVDSIGILPSQRGKGIGSQLLEAAIAYYVTGMRATLGLLVEVDNPKARKLYTRLGFQYVDDNVLVGKRLEHLQLYPEKSALPEV